MKTFALIPLFAFAVLLASCTERNDVVSTGTDSVDAPDPRGSPPALHFASPPNEPGTPLSSRQVPASEIQGADLSVLVALSKDEAWWLVEHGYPTRSELEALPHLDEQSLFLAMHQGDGKAAALLGHVRALNGDLSGASAAFARGAQLGSIYAMEQHALIELLDWSEVRDGRIVSSPPGIKALFIAKLNVARMLGDHRADHYINAYASDVDMSMYSDDVLAQTMEYMRQYGMTEAPRAPDPRPNVELWMELDGADPSTDVTIYGRPDTFP